MRNKLILILALFNLNAQAQLVKRTFLPVNPKAEQVKVIAEKHATYVLKLKQDKSLEVIAFDDALQEKWGIGMNIDYPVYQLANAYQDQLVLLMSGPRGRAFVLLEIDQGTGHYTFSEYAFSTSFRATKLVRYRENFWVYGWIEEAPVAFQLDAASQAFKTLPLGHANKVPALADFVFDEGSKELDMLMQTTENGYRSFLLRSVNLKGEITRNVLFHHPGAELVDMAYQKLADGRIDAIGTLSKKGKKSVSAITRFKWSDGELTHQDFSIKTITGMDSLLDLSGTPFERKQVKSLKSMDGQMDAVHFDVSGTVTIALENFEKDYEVRGLLQREADEQSLIDQVDLNRYGRRDFDVDESTLNERADQFSNTDAAAYRYRELIIDRVQEQGNRHASTTIFKLNDQNIAGQRIRMPKAVNFSFSQSINLKGDHYWIADEIGLTDVRLEERTARAKLSPMMLAPYGELVAPEKVLNFGFFIHEKVFYLMLQRIDLGASSN